MKTLGALLSTPLGCLWIASGILGICAAVAVARRGLATKYPGLLVYLVGSVARSAYLFYRADDGYGYRDAWLQTQWLSIGLWLILALDAGAALVRQVQINPGVAARLAGGAAIVAATSATVLWGYVDAPWGNVAATTFTQAALAAFVCALALIGVSVYTRSFGMRFGSNLRVFIAVVCGVLSAKALSFAWIRWSAGNVMEAQYLLVGGEAAARCLWLWGMRRWRQIVFSVPPQPGLVDEIERSDEWMVSEAKRRA